MRVIVCLGNPGPEYEKTRHNVGFLVADYLSVRHSIPLERNRLRATFGRGRINGEEVIIAKPQTFMNDSGVAAQRLVHFFKIAQEDFITVYDDIALELGMLRFRRGGSDAGHKGLRSIASHLGTQDIQRLRMGVGAPPPGGDARAWVLSSFRPNEREAVEDMVARAAQGLARWVTEGVERAMNEFNS